MSEENIDNCCLYSNTPKEDSQSFFSLKRSNSSATAPFISVDFSLPDSLRGDSSLTSINIIPTFNVDGKFYTPSFILGSEVVFHKIKIRINIS